MCFLIACTLVLIVQALSSWCPRLTHPLNDTIPSPQACSGLFQQTVCSGISEAEETFEIELNACFSHEETEVQRHPVTSFSSAPNQRERERESEGERWRERKREGDQGRERGERGLWYGGPIACKTLMEEKIHWIHYWESNKAKNQAGMF